MQSNGINLIAVLVAAIAVYAVGFVIYGLVIPPETSMQWSGITQGEMDAVGMARMPMSPLMPLMISYGTALAIKWRGAGSLAGGALTGLLMALLFLVGGRLYSFVYGVEGVEVLILDSVHLLLNGIVAGAVIGAWPRKA